MNNSPKIRRVLVPVAIGNEDIIALEQALVFHETYGCEVTLLNVLTEVSVFQKVLRTDNLKKRKEIVTESLKKMVMSYFNDKLPDFISFKVASGNLIDEILKVAEDTRSDLIIINKRERTANKFGAWKNENADKLIANSHCPVLTITKNDIKNKIEDILIPVDITKKITTKIAWVKYLAKKFNAKVHVVSVLNVNIAPLQSLAYQKALQIEESMQEAGLEVNVELLKANNQSMHDVVLSHIKNLNPDLVLIMTHQESILYDNYIGKFATEVIHQSDSPIFSLVPRKETLISNIIDSFSTQQKDNSSVEKKEKQKENIFS